MASGRIGLKKGASEFTLIRQTKASLMLIAKQTEAQEWIQSVLNEKFKHKDFAKSLQDGVLLCRLALAIQPGSVKKINANTTTKWKMIENLAAFVQFCKGYGVHEALLFQGPDLVEEANMMKVVNCIHNLAAIAAKNGFQPAMETTEIETTTLNAQAKQELDQQMAELKKKEQDQKKKLADLIGNNDDMDSLISNSNKSRDEQGVPAIQISPSPTAATSSPAAAQTRARAVSNQGIAKRVQEEQLSTFQEDEQRRKEEAEKKKKQEEETLKNAEEKKKQEDAQKTQKERETLEAKQKQEQLEKQQQLEKEKAEAQTKKEEEERAKKEESAAMELKREQSIKLEAEQQVELRRQQEMDRIEKEAARAKAKEEEKKANEQPASPTLSASQDGGAWLKRAPSDVSEEKDKRRSNILMGDRSPSNTPTPPQTPSPQTQRITVNVGGGFSLGAKTMSEEKILEREKRDSLQSSGSNRASSSNSMDDVVLKRRTWKLRLEEKQGQGNNMNAISDFYKSLKSSAEAMNKEEVIELQIKKNKEDLLKELSGSRMEIREVSDDHSMNQEEEEADRRERMRIEAINEIFLSEKYYVRDLETVVKTFLKPLRNAGDILPVASIDAMFSNVELIWKVNNEIKSSLIQDFQAAGNIQLMNVGKVFLGMVDYMRIYSIYSSNQNQSMKLYDQLKKENKNFAAFLAEAESKPDVRGLNLLGFLIKPIQRICKYPLLFRELLKHTPADHVDFESLQKCYAKTEEVAEYVNEKKRETDSLAKMLEIQDAITDTKGWNVLAPGRQFIKEGILTATDANGKSGKERHFFLFSDVLLSTTAQYSKNKANYKFKAALPLVSCSLIPESKIVENAFEIVIRAGEKETKLILQAQNSNDKTHWVSNVTNVLNTLGSGNMSTKRQQSLIGSLGSPELTRENSMTKEGEN